MIKNERQYRISKAQASRFRRTLEELQQGGRAAEGLHPRIAQAQIDAVASQLTDLEDEIQDYEALRRGEFQVGQLVLVDELATMLIKARIANRLSQKDLAQRLGLKEQQIQQYEATDYTSASLRRLQEVAHALGVEQDRDFQPSASREP